VAALSGGIDLIVLDHRGALPIPNSAWVFVRLRQDLSDVHIAYSYYTTTPGAGCCARARQDAGKEGRAHSSPGELFNAEKGGIAGDVPRRLNTRIGFPEN
jgi:hypothetical protein